MSHLLKRVALLLAGLCLSFAVHAQSTWGPVQSVNVAGMTHGHMFYQVLLLNYTGTGTKSPVLVYEHENSEGDKCYDGSAPCTTLTATLANGGSGVQDWFNNSTFQSRYCAVGCIVVSVAADQTSDPSGQTSNFGGYQDTPGSEPNERGVVAVIQNVLATLNADPGRVYVTGDSLGGIGSQAIALDYGVRTGSVGGSAPSTTPNPLPSGFLHTVGNQIVSSTGANVRLSCVGYEPFINNPATDFPKMRTAGFNCIRADYNDRDNCPGGVCSFTATDAVVNAATAANMKVIFSHHSNEGGASGGNCGSQQANGVWYDQNSASVVDGVTWNTLATSQNGCGTAGTVTYATFKANSIAMAAHYAGNSTVIAWDLWNEPLFGHPLCGAACPTPDVNWGNVNGSDIKLMYQSVGSAVEAAAPGVLIVAEGVINCTGTYMAGAAMSPALGCMQELTVVGSRPLTINNPSGQSVVVYSTHDYPNDVSGQNPDNGANSVTARNAAFGYLVINGTAPVWVGEGGSGCAAGAEAAWCAAIVAYSNGTAAGGPTFTGTQQGIGMDWWFWGPPGSGITTIPGVCADAACSTMLTQQSQFWNKLLYYPIVNSSQIITAVMPFSGAVFRGGLTAPTNTQTAQISGGPWQFNVNGVTDTSTSSNPTLWSEPVWRAITGNSNYPGQPLGGRAGSSNFFFLLDTSLGHDVWDTYRNFPKAQPLLDGLFAQTSGGAIGGGGTLTGTPKSVLPPGYFKAVGNQIQDGSGNNVRLACTGYNSQTANKPSDMAIIRTQGFNCVRVPWYDALDFPGGVASFGRMDTIVNAATGQNLRVILDHHSNEGVGGNNFCTSQQANGLWYDLNSNTPVAGITWNSTDNFDGCGTSGTVTYAQFKANWVAWVNHYKTNQTVMAADFDNEPTTYCHLNNGSVGNSCGAKWGSNDGTDMKAAVNDVGAAILAVNPNWLISVTGIINSGNLFNGTVKGSAAYPVTVGEPMDLSTVQSNPLTCCTGQVIYSIHEYPTSISGQQPDSGPNATTLRNAAWGLVAKNNFAPLFIGELGASLDGTNGASSLADEQAWATGITQYINGQLGGQGAPTFSGCQQPISTDWWNFGNNAGEAPDGTLNPDGTSKSGQQAFWSTLLFTTCSTQSTGGGGGGGGPVTTAWNPLDMSNITLSASNTVAANTVIGISGVRSTTSQTTGKRCFEEAMTNVTSNWDAGIANQTYLLSSGGGLGGDTNGIGFDPNSTGGTQGIFFGNAVVSSAAVSTPSVNGDKATICADLDAKLLWATSAAMRGGGNNWNNSASADPATATGGISFAGMTCPCFIAFNSNEAGSSATINATGSFAVATPTGFVAWQTTATGGKPVILIFGANDNFPKYANDDGPAPFMMDLKR